MGRESPQEKFDRILPIGVRIGESRELYDMRDGSSAVDGGEFEGMTLRDLLRHNSAEIMGCDWDASKPFPVIKILDCQQILSLQVHPDKLSAERFGGKEKRGVVFYKLRLKGALLCRHKNKDT
ncbi:MAG: type I phosphomannose isomerase catalytic subunit [Bacilli bacterium]